MNDRRPPSVAIRRLRAILILRNETVAGLAAKLSVSDAHLRAVVGGVRRPSARLGVALIMELGVEQWGFVRGSVNVLSAS